MMTEFLVPRVWALYRSASATVSASRLVMPQSGAEAAGVGTATLSGLVDAAAAMDDEDDGLGEQSTTKDFTLAK
ncbi:hypothetical protein HaLaN_16602, partial [Haematococcus lacustris]